ncbi:MAG: ArsR family transcriptional regulator [Nitrospirae bacterium]|nr:MAG: ArsR family transcriptional regulator [Nitrospirota bacterium]
MNNQDNHICEIDFFDPEKIASVRKRMKPERVIQALSETFKTLGDPTRVKILFALSQDELCVCDLAKLLGTTKSNISHQLRLLRGQRLVRYRKVGKMVYYRLDDEHIENLFIEGLKHVEEKK